jgi:hypothetical protein
VQPADAFQGKGVMSEDSFIREVEEEMRREQIKALWNRFGNIVIGVALLVVAATAGYRGFEYWSNQQAAKSGDAYIKAVELSGQGKQDEAVTQLEELAKTGSGDYPALARLRMAGEIEDKGDRAGAIAAFDAIAADTSFDEGLRSVARLRAGLIAVDVETFDQVKTRLEPMAAAGQPFRSLAREALGLSAWKSGANQEAAKWFKQINDDAGATGDVRERAALMLDLLAGNGVSAAD